MSRTISYAPGQVALFDSDSAAQCFRGRTLSAANKVVRTGSQLEVRWGAQHFTHKGAMVMLASTDRRFCAYGEITNLLDSTKFNVQALYGKADGTDDGNNSVPVYIFMIGESTCASWIQRAMEDERVAGAFEVGHVAARPSRISTDVLTEIADIRGGIAKPMVVIGGLSSNQDLTSTSVNPSTVMAALASNLQQLLNDGHSVALINARPVDLTYGTTPNSTQDGALLQLNANYQRTARGTPDVAMVDWYGRFINAADTGGGARTGFYKDSRSFNTDGANEAAKDISDLLTGAVRGKVLPVLRNGIWDGPARGNGVGANVCGALETNASYTPSDTGASGSLSTHIFISGLGSSRTSVSSLIALADGSYKQRVVMTGNNADNIKLRIEGPIGAKIVAALLAGATYQVALRYAITSLVHVGSFEVNADATVNYPTLGALAGYVGAGVTHQGEPMSLAPTLYPWTVDRAGIMVMPQRIKFASDALSIDAFGINLSVTFNANGGSCILEFDHPTIRRLT